MASVTSRTWIGVGNNSSSGTAYNANWTVPNNITKHATANIVVRDSGLGNTGYLTASGSGT